MAPNIDHQVSLHQKLAVFGPFLELNHNDIRSGQMTYCLKALVSTVVLAPILGGLQWKIFALDFFQRCGTTLYIIEWTFSYFEQNSVFK